MGTRVSLSDLQAGDVAELPSPAQPPAVLVVEDECDVMKLIEYNLVRHGLRVREATSVAAARESLDGALPDLIILDVLLPDGSGFELCRELRQAPRTAEIPIVFVTASSEPSDREEGIAAGASDYITKPFAIRELTAKVNTYLKERGRHKTGRELLKFPPTLSGDGLQNGKA
ncbi:MAG: response regulator [Acidobacteria bacterium]|nr:response regulator [Acidobacteriota bacterium]